MTSTTRLTDATGLVMQTISAQHAAYCELLIGGAWHAAACRNQRQMGAQRGPRCLPGAAAARAPWSAPSPPAHPHPAAAIFYALTFPVQRPQLFVLSWPYFPQLEVRPGCWLQVALRPSGADAGRGRKR